ncbi:MAG: metallophosphoesterase [Lysinibacillus sp.]
MKKLIYLCLFIVFVVVFLYVNNHWIIVSEHVYESERVPENFDGMRIVQVSDLHDAVFGDRQEKLVEKVKAANPDVIFITGDVVDSNRYNLEQSLQAVREFVKLADVYYVLGNHEVATNRVDEIYEVLSSLGVHCMTNTSTVLERDGERIAIVGIEDPLMGRETDEMLELATKNVPEDLLTLLLAHRPEVFDVYVDYEMDVVFSGHAHGGQIRLPFIGGLIAPGQGLFPKYTAGVYEEHNTKMVVSRGLGNSVVPYRVFNLPEIVVLELHTK